MTQPNSVRRYTPALKDGALRLNESSSRPTSPAAHINSMSRNILRKKATGESGNPGEFGSHAHPDGNTITFQRTIDLTDIVLGMPDLDLNGAEEYLNENRNAIAEWVKSEYGAVLEVDTADFDGWSNARIVGGNAQLDSDRGLMVLQKMLDHLEDDVDWGDAESICDLVGHQIVRGIDYCTRCDKPFYGDYLTA